MLIKSQRYCCWKSQWNKFQMEFRRISLSRCVCVLSLLFFPMSFRPNLNGMHLHKKERVWKRASEWQRTVYNFITILILKLPVWMGKSYLRISLYMYDCDMHNIHIPVGYDFQFGYRPRNHIRKEIPKKRNKYEYYTHTRTFTHITWTKCENLKHAAYLMWMHMCIYTHIICIFTTPSVCNMSITPHLLFSFVTWEAAHRNSTSVPIIKYIWILYRWAYTF